MVKRWIRLRLTSGLSFTTALADLASLTRFSTFLDQAGNLGEGLAGIDRAVLERYLVWIPGQPGEHSVKEDCVTALNTFFTAIRQHGWDDTLPTSHVFRASRPAQIEKLQATGQRCGTVPRSVFPA